MDPDGELRLVMEYITGDELSAGSIVPVADEEDLIRYLFQLASGIADFHRAGIVHRDIKPHNCRLDSEGNLRIFDLGISSDLDESDITKLPQSCSLMEASQSQIILTHMLGGRLLGSCQQAPYRRLS